MKSLFRRFHGKEEVKSGGRYLITLEEDQKLYHMARLEISKVITGDKGEYRAVAQNKHGEGTATINLNFEGNGKPKYIFPFFSYHFLPKISNNCCVFCQTFLSSFPHIQTKSPQNPRRQITTFSKKADNTPRRRCSNYGMHTGSTSSARYHMVSR